MTRARRAGVATVVAVTTAAALSPGLSGSVAAAPSTLDTKSVMVAYGDGPVAQEAWDQEVRVTFRGAEGDRVSMSSSITGFVDDCEVLDLTGPGGSVPQRVHGFHVLPSSGRYTFTYSQDCWASGGEAPAWRVESSLQLLKLRVKRVRPGARVTLPARQGYVTAAGVAIGARTPPLVLRPTTSSEEGTTVATPQAQLLLRPTQPLVSEEAVAGPALLERGAPMEINSQDDATSLRTHRGFHLFYRIGEPLTVHLSRLSITRTTLQAPGVRFLRNVPRRLVFTARRGLWIRFVSAAQGSLRLSEVPVRKVRPEARRLWKLTTTRTYRLDFVSHSRGRVPGAVRPVRVGKPLVAGSAPATRLVRRGQPGVFPVQAAPGSRWYFTVTGTDLTDGWNATAYTRHTGWYDGCMLDTGVSDGALNTPRVVVVEPVPDDGGTITLGFQERPASPKQDPPEQMCWWSR